MPGRDGPAQAGEARLRRRDLADIDTEAVLLRGVAECVAWQTQSGRIRLVGLEPEVEGSAAGNQQGLRRGSHALRAQEAAQARHGLQPRVALGRDRRDVADQARQPRLGLLLGLDLLPAQAVVEPADGPFGLDGAGGVGVAVDDLLIGAHRLVGLLATPLLQDAGQDQQRGRALPLLARVARRHGPCLGLGGGQLAGIQQRPRELQLRRGAHPLVIRETLANDIAGLAHPRHVLELRALDLQDPQPRLVGISAVWVALRQHPVGLDGLRRVVILLAVQVSELVEGIGREAGAGVLDRQAIVLRAGQFGLPLAQEHLGALKQALGAAHAAAHEHQHQRDREDGG